MVLRGAGWCLGRGVVLHGARWCFTAPGDVYCLCLVYILWRKVACVMYGCMCDKSHVGGSDLGVCVCVMAAHSAMSSFSGAAEHAHIPIRAQHRFISAARYMQHALHVPYVVHGYDES